MMAHSSLAIDNREASANARVAGGQELREIAAATFRLASELRPLLNDEAAATLDQLVQDAERDACRIAVIGQAKAGKSTLVNALIPPPFACATTIVDTPVPNDPFLVRGKLSPEALESADAYIVVLNAAQALSSGEASVLRLLQGLQKSRLVVFVNRIDLLANPALDGEAVVADIRDKLAAEFPGVAIPVIAGSAVRLSGIGDLKTILSRLVLQGPAMLRLQRRQGALYEMVLNVDNATRGELRSLEQRIAGAHEEEAASRGAQAAEDLKRFNALPAAIMERVKAADRNFDRLKGAALRRLDTTLRDVVRRHVSQARRLLLAQPRFIRHEHIWQHDTLPLRRDLEREFQAFSHEVAKELREVERTASAEILDMVRELMPENVLVTEDATLSLMDPVPVISALGETVAVELDDKWRAWWRLWHGPRQRARKLEGRLSAELHPVIDRLLEAADAALEAYIVVSVQRFSQLVRDVGTTLDRRKLDLEARRSSQAEKRLNGSAKPDAVIQDCQTRLTRQTQRLKDCVRIAGDLKLLVRRCAAFGH
jgi:signal recognition particle receptor subunit beta